MVPPKGTGGIAEVHAEHVTELVDIAAKVTRQKNAVVFIDLIVHLGIQVVEIQIAFLCRGIRDKWPHQFHVGSACRDDERHLVFEQRTFQGNPARNHADAGTAFQVFRVSFIHSHIEH